MSGNFEPRIVAFLCNWCSYAGADLAGVSRFQYPTNTRTIRVMCSGRVDPHFVLDMLVNGADGVLVGGCHIGDCHYITGNYYAQRKIILAKKLLGRAGIEKDRLRLEWVSASEGERFAGVVTDFVSQIKKLGPLALDEKKSDSLIAARNASADFRLRAIVGKEYDIVEKGNVYGEKIPQGKMDELMDAAINDEYICHLIIQALKSGGMSAREIARKTGVPSKEVLQYLLILMDRGRVSASKEEGTSTKYLLEEAPP